MLSGLILVMLMSAPASAGDASLNPDVDAAAALLSRYPTGHVPVEVGVITAIDTLGTEGTDTERPLLASLVRSERSEIRNASLAALEELRVRLRTERRESFAASLPNWPELAAETGTEREGALCAAYARHVFGDKATRHGGVDAESVMDAARLLEESGDARGAIQHYTALAVAGDPRALEEIDGFGVDAERLLLGLLELEGESPVYSNEAGVLEVLVRNGEQLTVAVLSERAVSAPASDRATAADALVRMLDENQRSHPLPSAGAHDARRALKRVSADGLPEIREIARQGL